MNIGMFSETYYPEVNGVASALKVLKEQYESMGHNVYLFTTTNPAAKNREKHVYRVPSVQFRLRRLGVFVNPRLKSLIKNFNLDVVHTHTEFSLGIYGRSVARSLQLPMVHTMHTIYEEYTDYILRLNKLEPAMKAAARKITAAFCNNASAVIAPTQKTKDLLHEYGVTQSVYVVPSGIMLDKFTKGRADRKKASKIRAELGIADSDKLMVYVGRVSKEKNLTEVVRYLGEYLPSHPDVKFMVVGNGPALEGLRQQAEELGVASQIVFAGEQPWDEIGVYYGLGDVFVNASQSETQGLTYIEALASALPLVVRYDPCLDDVLYEGENGYTFSDSRTFAQALDRIFFTDGELERMSRNAVSSAVKFSAAHSAQTLLSIYATVIAANKRYTQAS